MSQSMKPIQVNGTFKEAIIPIFIFSEKKYFHFIHLILWIDLLSPFKSLQFHIICIRCLNKLCYLKLGWFWLRMSVIQPCFKYVSVREFVIKSKKASFPNSLESFNTSHVVSYSYWSLSLGFDYKQLLFKKPVKSNQTKIKILKKLNEF